MYGVLPVTVKYLYAKLEKSSKCFFYIGYLVDEKYKITKLTPRSPGTARQLVVDSPITCSGHRQGHFRSVNLMGVTTVWFDSITLAGRTK